MVTARRIAAHAGDTPANVPMPTLDAVVVPDYANRILYVRLPDQAGGGERAAWTRAFQALQLADSEGYQLMRGAPQLWASGAGSVRIAYGTSGDAYTLRFYFPAPDPAAAYSTLISRPDLYALVTIDLTPGFFVGCLFKHRP
jgi:hypothetical protein